MAIGRFKSNSLFIQKASLPTKNIINAGFENWSNITVDWLKYIDYVGAILYNNVTYTQEIEKVYSGNNSLKLTVTSPNAGITQTIYKASPKIFKSRVYSGLACIHYGKSDKTSAYFTEKKLVQKNFILENDENSSALRNLRAVRLDNNDFVEIFSATQSPEVESQGNVYIKRNGGEPSLFISNPNVRTWVSPGIIDLTTKYTWINMRLDSTGTMKLYATDIDRTFSTISNDRLIFQISATNVQSYSFVVLPSGKIIIPITYALVNQVSTGPWYLDILTSDDNLNTINWLNIPKTLTGRGLMEAHSVLLTTGNIAILSRTSQGVLAKSIFDTQSNTLSDAILTEIVQPQSGCYAKNLNNGDIVLLLNTSVQRSSSSSFPRKIICLAISSDNMNTWHSYHVIATSEIHGDSMLTDFPYIHQPYFYEDGEKLRVYYERVVDSSTISLYSSIGQNYVINNVVNSKYNWANLTVENPIQTAVNVELISVLEKNAIIYLDSYEDGDILATPYIYTDVTELNYLGNESEKTFIISNSGNGVFTYFISTDVAWLNVSPSFGDITTNTQTITASVNRNDLDVGNYIGEIAITSDVGNITINVNMEITQPSTNNYLLTGLRNLWNIDEISGTTLTDTISNVNLTLTGSTLLGQTAPINLLNSVRFYNNNGFAKTAINAISHSLTPSFSFWFRSTDTAGINQNILFSIEGGWFVTLTGTGSISGLQATFTGSATGLPTLGIYNDDNWHHVLASHSGGTSNVFIDGQLVGTRQETLFDISTLTRVSTIAGRYDNNLNFQTNCYIAQVAIWDVPKGLEDAVTLWNNGNGFHSSLWD